METVMPGRARHDRHAESRVPVHASEAVLFALLDDHTRLSAHMSRPSWRTGWMRMGISTDGGGGKAIGSHIRLAGRILGVSIFLDEVVVEREPPRRKVWETVGEPRLLVIGGYRMGFEIIAHGVYPGVDLRVFIDYDLPRGAARPLGWLLGGWYARWCTGRMARDARDAFAAAPLAEPTLPARGASLR